jgi:hypothetical protein
MYVSIFLFLEKKIIFFEKFLETCFKKVPPGILNYSFTQEKFLNEKFTKMYQFFRKTVIFSAEECRFPTAGTLRTCRE